MLRRQNRATTERDKAVHRACWANRARLGPACIFIACARGRREASDRAEKAALVCPRRTGVAARHGATASNIRRMAKKTTRRRPKKKVSSVEIIVRRGARDRFRKLKKKTAHLPVKVAWDRRRDERRAVSEEVTVNRRNSDRRGKPPFSWDVADFVVIEKVQGRHRRRD